MSGAGAATTPSPSSGSPRGIARWLRSLGGRTVIVTVVVAAIAVLVTAAASFPLIALAATAQAKQQLSLEVDALADRPLAALQTLVAERDAGSTGGIRLAVVSPDGSVAGRAAPLVTERMLRRLAAGGTVSSTVHRGDVEYVVEARPRSGGGAIVAAQRVDEIQRASREIVGQVLLALALGLVVAGVAGALLARGLARPLRQTAAVARRLAQGERGVPLPPQRIAEIDDVSGALNALDQALVVSEGRQREFLLSVSHELRTPLTAIRGYAEALADELVAPAETPGVGATLVAETERLDRFVADLLELARLEADDFRIERGRVDLGVLVGDAVRAWDGRCRALGIALTAELPDGTGPAAPDGTPLVVETDGMRARQLLDGLVENALRATPAGGTVVIAGARRPGAVVLEVRDSGPGLSDDDLARAFERGALREKYREVREVGTGLGLSIAARLARLLGATVGARRADGGGAVFSVGFPG